MAISVFELLGEGTTGELATLIGVEDLGSLIVGERLFDRFQAEQTSAVIENLQLRIPRLNQSTTAARYTKPRSTGI